MFSGYNPDIFDSTGLARGAASEASGGTNLFGTLDIGANTTKGLCFWLKEKPPHEEARGSSQ
jgi:hypothetical protein